MDGFVKIPGDEWKRLIRMLLASVLMGGVVWLAGLALDSWLWGTQWQKIVALTLIVGTGMTVYGILAIVMRVTSLAALKASFGGAGSDSK